MTCKNSCSKNFFMIFLFHDLDTVFGIFCKCCWRYPEEVFFIFFLSYCHYIKLIKCLSWYYSWNWIIRIKCSHQFNFLFRQGIGTKVILGVAPTSMPLFLSDCLSVCPSVCRRAYLRNCRSWNMVFGTSVYHFDFLGW